MTPSFEKLARDEADKRYPMPGKGMFFFEGALFGYEHGEKERAFQTRRADILNQVAREKEAERDALRAQVEKLTAERDKLKEQRDYMLSEVYTERQGRLSRCFSVLAKKLRNTMRASTQ